MSRGWIIALMIFVGVFLAHLLDLLGFGMPPSYLMARCAAWLLLIMLLLTGVVELGWGGGTRDK